MRLSPVYTIPKTFMGEVHYCAGNIRKYNYFGGSGVLVSNGKNN